MSVRRNMSSPRAYRAPNCPKNPISVGALPGSVCPNASAGRARAAAIPTRRHMRAAEPVLRKVVLGVRGRGSPSKWLSPCKFLDFYSGEISHAPRVPRRVRRTEKLSPTSRPQSEGSWPKGAWRPNWRSDAKRRTWLIGCRGLQPGKNYFCIERFR